MKRMLITIGYGDRWALASQEDAINLLGIFQRAVKVEQMGYSGPYVAMDDQTPPIDSISLADITTKIEIAEKVTAPPAASSDDDPIF